MSDKRIEADPVGGSRAGHRLAGQLRRQAQACAALGSPLYAGLLTHAAQDAEAGGVVAQVLTGYEGLPDSAALPLRLAGGVHRLVLEGRAPDLAPHYPSVGGTADADAAWPAFRQTVSEHRAELRDRLAGPPQTNEVGRAAGLLGALLHLAARWPLPVRLVEVGASAGLNLRADRFRYDLGPRGAYGPADSPVRFADPWHGSLPPLDVALEVVERAGCDPAPIDPTTPDGQLTLLSFIWPDQVARVDRLRGALEVAADVPARLVRASAAAFLGTLDPQPGTLLVVWHSVVWQYLDDSERVAAAAELDRLAAASSPAAPVAHLAFEPHGHGVAAVAAGFPLTLRTWPDGGERLLATAPAHGLPVAWV